MKPTDKSTMQNQPTNKVKYPLSITNGMAFVELPPIITQKDADRLCKMIQALVLDEKQGESV